MAFQAIIKEEEEGLRKHMMPHFSSLSKLKQLNEMFNLYKYVETKDISYLKKEAKRLKDKRDGKENVEPNTTDLAEKVSLAEVKKEKLSTDSSESFASVTSTVESATTRSSNLKEMNMNMPAPTKMPPKKKKIKVEPDEKVRSSTRSTRTKPRLLEVPKECNGKPSVIIQNTTVTMIDITSDKESESEHTDEEKSKNKLPVRTTRTKARKESESENTEDEKSKNKLPIRTTRTKTRKESESENTDDEKSRNKLPTRTTRTKTRNKKQQEVQQMDTLPVPETAIQNTTITLKSKTKETVIEQKKNSSEKEVAEDEHKLPEKRTTRTKTRHQIKKENEQIEKQSILEKEQNKKRPGTSIDNEKNTKRSKSKSSSEETNKSAQTDYEDAISDYPTVNQNPNATMVINSTMVVNDPKVLKKAENQEANSTHQGKTPPRLKSKKQQIKEIFSPYEKTPLKKKVEAFEKFGSTSKDSASKIPLLRNNGSSAHNKLNSPFSSKFIPKTCSTSKVVKIHPSKHNDSCNDSGLSQKSLSALKSSQAEFRAREKRRQEKEKEAQLKKEALLQAQADERRKKREEKQLKAQQQRELLMQKEKEKLLEVYKEKEEKHKQAVAGKEDKLQKYKEEAEKKRLLAKNKAKIAKEREAREVALAELAKKEHQAKSDHDRVNKVKGIPIYMTTATPLLPTEDCYDSDSEHYRRNGKPKPYWIQDLNKQLYVQLGAGIKIKNTLFCSINDSPNLVDIFENIDPKKLKRTSSAQWKKPPRYTLFSTTSDIIFSEDSD